MTYTPAPWEIMTVDSTGLPAIVAVNGPCIAEITKWTSIGKSNPDIIQANAQLIAAAPDLLKELKNITARLQFTIDTLKDGDIPHLYQDAVDEAKATIEKATS